MKNKKGQGVLVAMLLGVLLIGGVVAVLWATGVIQTGAGTPGQGDTPQSCETEPYINVNHINELKQGTSVSSVDVQHRLDGFYKNITTGSSGETYAIGDSGQLLHEKSGYIDKITDFEITKCGSNTFHVQMLKTSAPSLTLKDDSLTTLTDSATGGNAVNLSSSANQVSVVVEIEGTQDESTSTMLFSAETNDTQVDDMTLTDRSANAEVLEEVGEPEIHSDEFSGSGISGFWRVTDVVDGATDSYDLNLNADTDQTIGSPEAPLYTNLYTEQADVDVDGTFFVGVEDSDGTAVYEDTVDYDARIV